MWFSAHRQLPAENRAAQPRSHGRQTFVGLPSPRVPWEVPCCPWYLGVAVGLLPHPGCSVCPGVDPFQLAGSPRAPRLRIWFQDLGSSLSRHSLEDSLPEGCLDSVPAYPKAPDPFAAMTHDCHG